MKLNDYLHLYMGASLRVTFDDGSGGTLPITPELLVALSHNNVQTMMLELRPVTDMTTAERLQNFEIFEVIAREYPTLEQGVRCEAESTRNLLAQGFDVFGLIEAGLAIAKITQA